MYLQGLDYDICENQLWEKGQLNKPESFRTNKELARWIVSLLIGILTALVGCTIAILVEEISYYKYSWLQQGL